MREPEVLSQHMLHTFQLIGPEHGGVHLNKAMHRQQEHLGWSLEIGLTTQS